MVLRITAFLLVVAGLAASAAAATARDGGGDLDPAREAMARWGALSAEAAPDQAPAEEERPDEEDEPEDEPEEEPRQGLFPFLPQWFPLGPPWDPEAPPRWPPPPAHSPETMGSDGRPGALPRREAPVAEVGRLTFVPVPIIMADPNLGFGAGLMPVVLVHPRRRIEWIVAPSVSWNEILGVNFANRILYYPTLQEELFIYNDYATGGRTEHEARFHGRDRFIRGSDFRARGYIGSDPTRRFWGIGAETEEDDESDYRLRETAMEADIGYRFTDALRLGLTWRYRQSTLGSGIVDDTPNTVDAFPDVGGVEEGEATVLAFGPRLTIDLRDDPIFPTSGALLDGFFETSTQSMISTTRFVRFGASVSGYVPIRVSARRDLWVSVVRGDFHMVRDDGRLPFWEQPMLGGSRRLRGFGSGRFTDDAYLLFTKEERFRVYDVTIRENHLEVEVAGFFEAGRVFGETPLDTSDWQYVLGGGARVLITESGIIARGDVGFGGEGPAIFLTLGYPF